MHRYIDTLTTVKRSPVRPDNDGMMSLIVTLCRCAGGGKQAAVQISLNYFAVLLFTRVIKSEDSSQKKRAAEYDIPNNRWR